ncbi:MAG: HepT-like ribonuclease domain-containing protein [Pyrinomonadaceae bacterium]
MKDDAVYLRHIAECIRRVEENIAGGRDLFLTTHALQDATLRNLQTMSEATQRLSDTIKSTYPEIEWVRIEAFRNVLVHNYLGIDLELIWETIERDMPELKRAVTEMLQDVKEVDS